MKLNLLAGHSKGESVNFVGHDCINMFPVILPDVDVGKEKIILKPTSGLQTITTVGSNPILAGCTINNQAYFISGTTVYTLIGNTATSIGTISTPQYPRLCMIPGAENFILICNGSDGYVIDQEANTVLQVTDGDFPGAECGDFEDGYWVVVRSGRVYFSELNNPFAWVAADVFTPTNKPDKAIALKILQEEIYVFGNQSSEVYYNDGSTPFQRRAFSTTGYGLLNKDCLTFIDNSIVFLSIGIDRIIRVIQISPGGVRAMSSDSLNYELSAIEGIQGAYCMAYCERGHNMFQITVPNVDKTWVLDLSTIMVHRRSSFLGYDATGVPINGRHIANCVWADNVRILMGDYRTGNLYELRSDVYTENSNYMLRTFTSPTFRFEDNYVSAGLVEIDVETGLVSSSASTTPTLKFSYSRDGGYVYSRPKWKTLGAAGKYNTLYRQYTLGRSKNWNFKIEISDASNFTIGQAVVHGIIGTK